MKIFTDTNVILNSEFNFENYEKVYISIISIEELDKLKRDERIGYQARQAIKKIEKADNKEIIFKSTYSGVSFLEHNNDNEILKQAYERYKLDNGLVFYTDDLCLKIKADELDLPCERFEFGKNDSEYKGYIVLDLSNKEVLTLFDDIEKGINKYSLIENQYIIINEYGKRKPQEFKYINGKLEHLKLPDSKVIKGLNSQQRLALDLLYNKDIPIKIIIGGFGSGKTYLATKMGVHHVFDKGSYGKMLILRNPLGSGEAIGYLKGDKSEKIGDFFRCVEQYLDVTTLKDKSIENYVEKDIPYFIKGLSYGSKYVLVEEAEDMDLRILNLIGSRIESDSCVIYCGDYKQAESKYINQNGLYQLINNIKGNPLVGIVCLEEDVRSEASKVFC